VTARLPYTVLRRISANPSYTAYCHVCGKCNSFWDFKRNARWCARSHIQEMHPEIKGLREVRVEKLGTWRTVAGRHVEQVTS